MNGNANSMCVSFLKQRQSLSFLFSFVIIHELLGLPGKYSVVVFVVVFSRCFQVEIIHLLDYLPTKATGPNLPCYLNHNCRKK